MSKKKYVSDNSLRYFLSKIKTLINNKANISHTHSIQDINNGVADKVAIYNASGKLSSSNVTTHDLDALYNIDNSKTIQEHLNDKADVGHKHFKSDIKDFPTSMPASDVYSWAKTTQKPSYSWNEINGKPSTMPPSSHSHDERYYTEGEINSKLNEKANKSHPHSSGDITLSQSTINAYQSMGMS